VSVLVVSVAMPPLKVTAPSGVNPSLNVTLPDGVPALLPTLATRVTASPSADGSGVDDRMVAVAAG
jgi:hypothetical protein